MSVDLIQKSQIRVFFSSSTKPCMSSKNRSRCNCLFTILAMDTRNIVVTKFSLHNIKFVFIVADRVKSQKSCLPTLHEKNRKSGDYQFYLENLKYLVTVSRSRTIFLQRTPPPPSPYFERVVHQSESEGKCGSAILFTLVLLRPHWCYLIFFLQNPFLNLQLEVTDQSRLFFVCRFRKASGGV